MASRQPPRRFPWKTVFLVLICSLAGGAIVYWLSPQILTLTRRARERGLTPLTRLERAATAAAEDKTNAATEKAGAAKPSEPGPEKMKRAELEREVRRLRARLAAREADISAKDRENSELKLQLKLLKDGSRTRN